MLRAFFVRLSENSSLRTFAERSALGRRVSGRFVAGTEIADAVRATQAVNRAGMSVSIDNLGENVTNPDEARRSSELYHQILDAIAANDLNANISLKLTHMGLDVDEKLARNLVGGLVAKAASMDPPGFVRIDMEGSPYTTRTLEFVHELHRTPGNANSVGTVIQAYLKRSESDVEKLLAEGIRIRLCKGAYEEPEEIAFPAKSDVDANYVKLMKILMKSGIYHGLATHDESIIQQAQAFAIRENFPATRSNSKCSTAFAATCNRVWCATAGESASTYRSAVSGIPTSCGGWASVRPTFCSSRATCCGRKGPAAST
jgi:proline dehydrogenase